jgi:hypothetical protein
VQLEELMFELTRIFRRRQARPRQCRFEQEYALLKKSRQAKHVRK